MSLVKEDDLVYRLHKRAEIRKQITTRKSVQNNEPDRIADLLEEAADEIAKLRMENDFLTDWRDTWSPILKALRGKVNEE
jgi:chorismate mutase